MAPKSPTSTAEQRNTNRAEKRALEKFRGWPGFQTSGDFARDWIPPVYVIEDVMQQGYLYTLTGQTGAGKTFLALFETFCIASGRNYGSHSTVKGGVVFFAGENPDDVKTRWTALCRHMGENPDDLPVKFVAGRFDLSKAMPQVLDAMEEVGDVIAIYIDTAQAFFTGENENDNHEQLAFASTLRELTTISSKPAVTVLCHPKKGTKVTDFPIEPRGGGAFLGEVDGNRNIIKRETYPMVVELLCTPKWRGVEFDRMKFHLKSMPSPLLDSKGGEMSSRVVVPLDETEKAALSQEAAGDAKALLDAMRKADGASLSELRKALSWTTRSKVKREMEKLRERKLVTKVGEHWRLVVAPDGDDDD